MITFDTSYTEIGFGVAGDVSEVPINGYLRSITIDKYGVTVMDANAQWGLIRYQDTSFSNNKELFNYLYSFTQINKPQTKKIEICSAELIDCFTNPVELLPAQGIGLIIMPISLGYKYKYKSVAYNFAQNLYVHCSTKTDADALFEMDKGIINASGAGNLNRSSVLYGIAVGVTSNDDSFVENDSLVFKAKTSDATLGDGYLTLYIHYVIVEESWYDGVYCT